jgi:hypothetical protein
MPSLNVLTRQTHKIEVFGLQYFRLSNTKDEIKHPNELDFQENNMVTQYYDFEKKSFYLKLNTTPHIKIM